METCPHLSDMERRSERPEMIAYLTKDCRGGAPARHPDIWPGHEPIPFVRVRFYPAWNQGMRSFHECRLAACPGCVVMRREYQRRYMAKWRHDFPMTAAETNRRNVAAYRARKAAGGA